MKKTKSMLDVTKGKDTLTIRKFDMQTGNSEPLVTVSKSVKNYLMNNNDIKKQPVDFNSLADLLENDSTHTGSINLKKAMILGRGWDLLQTKYKASKMKTVNEFIETPSKEPFETFYDILDNFLYDYETFGNAYIEFVKLNDTIRFSHTRAKDIYVKVNKANDIIRYVELDNNGKEVNSYYKLNDIDDMKEGRHYLARLSNYTPGNGYYGLPQYISAIPAIVENIYIRQFGINFFNNAATPSLAISITGGDWGTKQEQAVKDFLSEEGKGVENAHKILVLHVENEKSKVKVDKISETFEGNFLEESDKNRDEIARAHGPVPPKLLGITGSSSIGGGGEAIGELKIFIETCINGKQKRFQDFLNILFKICFNVNPKFKFQDIDITTSKDDAVIHNLYSKMIDVEGKAVMNVDEIRNRLNLSDKPEGAKMPMKNSMLRDYSNEEEPNSDGDARTSEDTQEESAEHDIQNLEPDKNEK